MIFPGDANHHGTLFGGVALAHMDKVAFLAASRHGRAPFVTAASDKIDFKAPGRIGEMVEVTGRVIRVGHSSLDVEVELVAEALVTGERRTCASGRFAMVAVKAAGTVLPLPQLGLAPSPASDDCLRMIEIVFPSQTNHYGSLYGGDALKMMGKAAFIAATRHARAVMVMAASDKIEFTSPIREGELVELAARPVGTGRTSVQIAVDLWAEALLTGERRLAGSARFTMVAVDREGRPAAFG
ncbi:acyl-CoA thioesterase [Sphingomonas sp. HMWF008]|nr:acyl-CoA thioesterase [Sphingomonas sp. HMWF008]